MTSQTLERAALVLLIVMLIALGFIVGTISAEHRFMDDLCDNARGYIAKACEAEGWR